MERRPRSILTTLAVSVLALTLIAPWTLGQDPDPITEIRRQAGQGDVNAQFRLGYMYANGEGALLQDHAEAVKLYRLAAEQGLADAQTLLGLIYARGTDVPEDYVVAYAWLNLAAAQGHELARENKDRLQPRMTPNQIARAQELSATLFDRIN